MAALGTNKLTLTIDGDERAAEVSKIVLTNEEAKSDFVSFADAASGGSRTWKVKFTAVQDPGDADSVWNIVFDHVGDEIDFLLRPYGNATASSTQPHFSGTAVVAYSEDFIGGEADASSTNRFTFDAEWELTSAPSKISS